MFWLLFLAAASGSGDSCVLTSDCEAGLACVMQVCTPETGACQRTQDCADGQRCKSHVCVDEPPPVPHAVVRLSAQNGREADVSAVTTDGEVRGKCRLPCMLDVPLGPYVFLLDGPRVRKANRRIDVRGDMDVVFKPEFSAPYITAMTFEFSGAALAIGGSFVAGFSDRNEAALVTGLTLVGVGFALSVIAGPILFAVSGVPFPNFGPFFIVAAPLPKSGGEMGLGLSF